MRAEELTEGFFGVGAGFALEGYAEGFGSGGGGGGFGGGGSSSIG